MQILTPILILAGLGLVFGIVLAVASKAFAVEVDERVPAVTDVLPGANCGGCGYSGCAALAEAIVKGEAKPNACTVGGNEVAEAIGKIMGISVEKTVRKRAQVMCSGTCDLTTSKYIYEGAHDCIAAAKLGGGDKACANGCVGLGTCADACPFEAITVENGVAAVDYHKCRGCGVCVATCPKHVIELIPYDSAHWIGCKSAEKGAVTRKVCEVGCIGCRLCEKNCEYGAVKVEGSLAVIDYEKCVDCGVCVEKCPRHIIWSAKSQGDGLTITCEVLKNK
ncbi:MAG: Fe-S cluster domain-containing protein [Clostridia bacterium]|nr:Fe-S cluster domain-containing protein [Clostridia bacterium]